MSMFHRFPYTDFNDINLDWIINQLKEINEEWKEYQLLNILNFPNPNEWNSKQAYPKLSVVMGPDGNSYLSTTAVPPGVIYSDTRYWIKIIDIGLKDKNQDKAIETNAGKIKANSDLIKVINEELKKSNENIGKNSDMINDNKNLIKKSEEAIVKTNEKIKSLEDSISDMLKINEYELTVLAGDSTNSGFGSCSVLRNKKTNLCVVIDFGNDSGATKLKNYLQGAGVKYIDYAIISHYHSDHINGLFSLSEFVNDKTKFVLPHGKFNINRFVPSAPSWLESEMNKVKAFIASNRAKTINPTSEGYRIVADEGLSLVFNNIENFSNYYQELGSCAVFNANNTTNYNNFSLVTTCIVNGFKIINPGDLEVIGQKTICKYINGCDVYIVEHHGLDFSTYPEYVNKLHPKYSIIPSRQNNTGHETDTINHVRYTASRLAIDSTVIATRDNAPNNIYIDITDNLELSPCNSLKVDGAYSSANMLPKGTDLNKLLTPGKYMIPEGGYCDSIVNFPTPLMARTAYCITVDYSIPFDSTIVQTLQPAYFYVKEPASSVSWLNCTFKRRMGSNGTWNEWCLTGVENNKDYNKDITSMIFDNWDSGVKYTFSKIVNGILYMKLEGTIPNTEKYKVHQLATWKKLYSDSDKHLDVPCTIPIYLPGYDNANYILKFDTKGISVYSEGTKPIYLKAFVSVPLWFNSFI